MATDSETVDSVLIDGHNASYNKVAKRILSVKMCLADFEELGCGVLGRTIKGISRKYVKGNLTLTIGTIPMDIDITNVAYKTTKKAKKIKDLHNKDASATEGTAIFDIMFRVIVSAMGIEALLNRIYRYSIRYLLPKSFYMAKFLYKILMCPSSHLEKSSIIG